MSNALTERRFIRAALWVPLVVGCACSAKAPPPSLSTTPRSSGRGSLDSVVSAVVGTIQADHEASGTGQYLLSVVAGTSRGVERGRQLEVAADGCAAAMAAAIYRGVLQQSDSITDGGPQVFGVGLTGEHDRVPHANSARGVSIVVEEYDGRFRVAVASPASVGGGDQELVALPWTPNAADRDAVCVAHANGLSTSGQLSVERCSEQQDDAEVRAELIAMDRASANAYSSWLIVHKSVDSETSRWSISRSFEGPVSSSQVQCTIVSDPGPVAQWCALATCDWMRL